MTKLVRFFYRYLYWLVPWWYGMTQTFTRKKRYPEVRFYGAVTDIPPAIQYGRRWREDPIKGLLDVLMTPRKFQWHIEMDHEEFGDCDDHALYWATALLKSKLADKAWLGTVWYTKPDGSSKSGHVVCVFSKDGRTYWADYGNPSAFGGKWEWASQMANRRGKIVQAAALTEVRLRKSGEPKLCKKTERIVP